MKKTNKQKLLLMMKLQKGESANDFSKRVIDELKRKGVVNEGGRLAEKSFYTAQELADKLRVNIMTIYRYIKAGKLRAYKFGKEFRIDKRDFGIFLSKTK